MSQQIQLKHLLENIPDLVWLKDPDGIYLHCNRRLEQLFGVSQKEIKGKTDYDFVDRELADFFRKNDRKAIVNGNPTRNEEWVTFISDGHRELLETIKTPLYDDNGQLIGVLGIGRNITERKQMEEELVNHRANLEEQVEERTRELRTFVNAMAGREVRMAELKEVIATLREQLEQAGIQPAADELNLE